MSILLAAMPRSETTAGRSSGRETTRRDQDVADAPDESTAARESRRDINAAPFSEKASNSRDKPTRAAGAGDKNGAATAAQHAATEFPAAATGPKALLAGTAVAIIAIAAAVAMRAAHTAHRNTRSDRMLANDLTASAQRGHGQSVADAASSAVAAGSPGSVSGTGSSGAADPHDWCLPQAISMDFEGNWRGLMLWGALPVDGGVRGAASILQNATDTFVYFRYSTEPSVIQEQWAVWHRGGRAVTIGKNTTLAPSASGRSGVVGGIARALGKLLPWRARQSAGAFTGRYVSSCTVIEDVPADDDNNPNFCARTPSIDLRYSGPVGMGTVPPGAGAAGVPGGIEEYTFDQPRVENATLRLLMQRLAVGPDGAVLPVTLTTPGPQPQQAQQAQAKRGSADAPAADAESDGAFSQFKWTDEEGRPAVFRAVPGRALMLPVVSEEVVSLTTMIATRGV